MPTISPSLLVLTSVLVAPLLAVLPVRAPADAEPDLAAVERLIASQTNALRRTHDQVGLRAEPQLAAAARDLARHMARTDRYGHEADGRSVSERVVARGYDACLVAENIAYQHHPGGIGTTELAHRFMQGWEDSREHRDHLLDPDVVHLGVALERGADSGRIYAVQVFGRPQAHAREFQLANRSTVTLKYRVDGRAHTLPPRTTMRHTQCRAPRLALDLPGTDGPTTLMPQHGEKFVIERTAPGKHRIRKG